MRDIQKHTLVVARDMERDLHFFRHRFAWPTYRLAEPGILLQSPGMPLDQLNRQVCISVLFVETNSVPLPAKMVDGRAAEAEGRLQHGFGKGRMRVGRPRQVIGRCAGLHGERAFGDQIRRVRAHEVDP